MDLLRSCYFSEQRLFQDRPDVLTPGRWHFSPEGAQVLPFPTSFASSEWDNYRVDEQFQIGEVRNRGAYSRGFPDHRYDGMHFCGDADVWLNGIPYAGRPGLELGPQGIPLCCLPANQQSLVFEGRVKIAGLAAKASASRASVKLGGVAPLGSSAAAGLAIDGLVGGVLPVVAGVGMRGVGVEVVPSIAELEPEGEHVDGLPESGSVSVQGLVDPGEADAGDVFLSGYVD